MNIVRWGLVSTANINRRVIPAIRMSQRGRLVAVAGRNLENVRAYARQWEIPRPFGSYQAMLDSGEVDAVYISLPNHLHAEWTIRALKAGLHVLCEKPFAISLEEVDAMIAAARVSGRRLAEAFMYRHHPQTRVIGEWVQSGRLGKIVLVRGIFNFKMLNRDGNVRLYPADLGGGCLWDVGVYPVSLAQYIYGSPPAEVIGLQQLGDTGVDEVFAGQLRYPAGGLAQIASSFRTPYHTHLEILGEKGSLTATRPFTNVDEGSLMFSPDQGEAKQIVIPNQELYLGQIEDMNTAILDGSPNYLTLEESRSHVATVLALYESARRGMPVVLPPA